MLPNDIRNFVNRVFEIFNTEEIKFVVLRNYENLPYKLNSGDVDLLVSPSEVDKAFELLKFVAKEQGGTFYLKKFQKGLISSIFYFRKDNELDFVQIDLFTEFGFKGVIILRAQEILSKRREFKDFWVPCPSHEIITAFLKPYLMGGEIKKKYLDRYSGWLRDIQIFDEATAVLKNCIDDFYIQEFLTAIKEENIVFLKENADSFRLQLNIRCFMNSPILYIKHLVWHVLIEVYKTIGNPLVILFCNSDSEIEYCRKILSGLKLKVKVLEKEEVIKLLSVIREILDAKRNFYVLLVKSKFFLTLFGRDCNLCEKTFVENLKFIKFL